MVQLVLRRIRPVEIQSAPVSTLFFRTAQDDLVTLGSERRKSAIARELQTRVLGEFDGDTGFKGQRTIVNRDALLNSITARLDGTTAIQIGALQKHRIRAGNFAMLSFSFRIRTVAAGTHKWSRQGKG